MIPQERILSKSDESFIYANEAELLNVCVFGITSKEWRDKNPKATQDGHNIRDLANIVQLNVLANLESYNSILIKEGINVKDRFIKLQITAKSQLKSLAKNTYSYSIESPYIQKYGIDSTLRLADSKREKE